MVAWQRRVAGADQFRSAPIHRSESPTGYSSAGCSPAEPASASPVADNSTSNPGPARQSKCAAQPHCRDPVQVTLLVPVTTGVSSLLCAQGDISILRRHDRDAATAQKHKMLKRLDLMSDPQAHGVKTEADQGAAIQSPFTCRTVATSAPFANN